MNPKSAVLEELENLHFPDFLVTTRAMVRYGIYKPLRTDKFKSLKKWFV